MSDWIARKRVTPGAQSANTSSLQDLLGAVLRNMEQATEHLRFFSLGMTKLWALPEAAQTVAVQWWLASVYAQCANTYIQKLSGQASANAIKLREIFCQHAERWTEAAIGNESLYEVEAHVPSTSIQHFPTLSVDASNVQAVWSIFDLTHLQVRTDLELIQATAVPTRYRELLQGILAGLQPHAALYTHFQESWGTTTSATAQLDLIQRATTHIQSLFQAGQQLWAPYLIGDAYVVARSRKATLDDLELGFDPWAITDPEVVEEGKADPEAPGDLLQFWQSNPNPGRAYQLQQEINAARAVGVIQHVDGKTLPYPPWPTIWVARQPTTIGSVQLMPGDRFTLYTGKNADDEFVNEIRRAGKEPVASSAAPVVKQPTLDDLELGFDPWAITDPDIREQKGHDAQAIAEVMEFWQSNPNPGRAYQLQQEINAAREARHIRLMDGRALPFCPWTSVWVAWRPCTIGGVSFEGGELFTLYAGKNADDEFVNEIRRTGTFRLRLNA